MTARDRDNDYINTITETVFNDPQFVQLSLKGKVRLGYQTPWQAVIVRPVMLGDSWHLQISTFDERQDITKNYSGDDATTHLAHVLEIPFSDILLRTTTQDTHFRISKKGKVLQRTSKAPAGLTVDLSHDEDKALPLTDTAPDDYLQAVGIMNQQGEIRPKMRAKFNQINEFLKILDHALALEGNLLNGHNVPLRIVDFGCGSAYLTLAAYHYLNNVRGIASQLDGVDTNGTLIDKNTLHSRDLGWDDACFTTASITKFTMDFMPDIVISLHACDTATDDTLAQGIRNGAKVILSAPCCHHHLHQQLITIDPMRPVMRHGILKKRMADIITDSFRALILRIYGYTTDVIEFVGSEHTDRNLMIRAIKRDPVDTELFVAEYQALKAFWGVTPYLETHLGTDFAQRLER